MAAVPMEYAFLFAAALFALGLVGVLVRRNLIFMLMNIEVMLNAAAVAFVVAGARWGRADGQVMFILVLTVAAAEVAVGLALILKVHRRRHSVDADRISGMRG